MNRVACRAAALPIVASLLAVVSPTAGFSMADEATIEVGELVFDVLVAGPEDGPVVFMLHGFPQGAIEWRHQIPTLASMGFRVIAPNQRGYSPGARPQGVEAYGIPNLVADVVGMADAVGAETFHVVGHDWGAAVAWYVALMHPDRVLSLVPISVPHPFAFGQALADPEGQQARMSGYMEVFRSEGAEDLFLADDAAMLRGVYGGAGLTPAEVQEYVDLLGTREAIGAALNWYRAMNLQTGAGQVTPIAMPTMFVWSTDDLFLGREGAELTANFVEGPYRFEILEGVGHWVPEQAAEALNELLQEHFAPFVADGGSTLAADDYDLLLVGGRVLDGTGNPWRYADVGIKDGRIVAVGRLSGAAADRVIDVVGKIVAPGFIDMHSHADGPGGEGSGLRAADPHRRSAPNLVSQGITTVVVNQDGGSPLSIARQRATLENLGSGPNTILLVGHNSIRREVLGPDFRRLATDDEVQRMAAMVRQGIAEGAYGLSAGLEYVPGRWSDTAEVLSLVSTLTDTGGVYIVHERASGADPMWYLPSQHDPGPPTMLDNIVETIHIAESTRVPTVATHIKVKGADYWGSSGAIINLMRTARARGVEIWLDQYPYTTTGSDGSTVLIPPWALGYDRWGEGGDEDTADPDYAARLREVLDDDALRADLGRDVRREIARRGGAEQIFVFEYSDPTQVGKSLAQLARDRGVDSIEAAILLQLEGFATRPGGARLRGFSLAEVDVEALAAEPYTLTASDAGVAVVEDELPVHARYYGTFPRKIRRYAIELGALSVAQAVRTSTSLPAQVLRLNDRGLVREGLVADLVVFDLETIRDRATFSEPHQFAEGVEWVLVGGQAVVEEGRLTGALPGRVITLADSAF